MLEGYFVQTCEIITPVINRFGDYEYSSAVSSSCRFRQISTRERTTTGEYRDSDALVHLPSTASVSAGSIIKFAGIYYQVERYTEARKLGSTIIEFIKCEVKVQAVS